MKSIFDRESYFGLTRRQLQALYLVAAAGLAALVPLILFSGFWIQSELRKSQRDVEMFLGSRASALSLRVDAEVERQITSLQALAILPSAERDLAQFEESARRVTGSMSRWAGMALIEAGTNRTVFAIDAGASEQPDPSLVQKAVAERRPVLGTRPFERGRRGGVYLCVPVLSGGQVTHVLFANFDASEIQEIVRNGADDDVLSVVVDAHGTLLARSHLAETLVGQPALQPFLNGTAGRKRGLVRIESRDGEPLTVAFVRSDLSGWLASSSFRSRRADVVMSRSIWATIGAGAVSILLACILAVFIIHTVMERRVSNERLAASRALGELDARLLATSQGALNDQRKAASEREVLLREIYHRVKNNLQIVQSLLRLGSRDLDPDQREPFENAVRRIGAMARVHTLLYNSPDLASIDFKDYLDELLRELSEGFSAEERAIESVLQAEAMRMPLDTAVPLAFIAVEILTNSFKHAFPEGRSGRITVDVARDGDGAVLTIRDDGVGLTYDRETKRRLGLTIVRKLVQQIGGKLEEPPPGSSLFVVRFPLGVATPERLPEPVS